ncbi:MAG: YqgE/AlgH family protein [Deltaproteobacteria bacterium]|nr:YqgE/AlgH family protein [Deltaproteobacteria bacterium]
MRRSIPNVTLLILCAIGLASTRPLFAGENQFLTGQLLVATPEMGDPRFAETIVYIVEHDQNGAMGLVINRPLAKGPIADLLRGLGVESRAARGEIVIHYGGPVEHETAYVLHSDDYAGKGTTVVGGGVAVTVDTEIVRAIAEGKGPRQSLFIFGYAGWAPGQLEAEIRANAWFTIPAEKKLIFDDDPETKWEHAMARRKVKT